MSASDVNQTEESKKAELTQEELKGVKNLSDILKGTSLDHNLLGEESLSKLPVNVKRRLRALKKYQLESIKLETEFYKEVHALECKYAPSFQNLHDRRREIVEGTYEPKDEECELPLIHGLSPEDQAHLMQEPTNESGDATKTTEEAVGIPSFWLTALKSVELIAEMIQEHDEPILQSLLDIDIIMLNEPTGFLLKFHFTPNEFFSNSELTKTYQLKCDYDEEDPFEYDGPEIVECKGCNIDWKEDSKNVTMKLIKKKQKHKGTGSSRFVTKQVRADSFFNFFDPPENPDKAEDYMDEETRVLLHADFEVGQALRDRVIPRAVLFFTGEAHDDESFDGDENEDEDDEIDDLDFSED